MWNTIWNDWLLFPLDMAERHLGLELPASWGPYASRGVVILVGLFVFYECYLRFRRWQDRRHWRDDLIEADEKGSLKPTNAGFVDKLEGARNLEKTVGALKKSKDWLRLAEVYASVNDHPNAAKYYKKAKEPRRCADEWARAGKTLKAARLLMKSGDFATAARFFSEIGRMKDAASAYQKGGDLPAAADAFARAGSMEKAAEAFQEYFASTQEPPHLQLHAAELCFNFLRDQGGAGVPGDLRAALLVDVASRYEGAQRYDLAATLFLEAGDKGRAGSVYARAGKLQEAAACLRDAGKTREANLIGAQYYESRGRWAEAGMAYAGAGEFRRAGDCFSKANDPKRAAECYERAGEHYGAGLAYSHQRQYENAIRNLQKVRESDKNYALSRGLLGRCFYEMHDYEHCAATLENYLINTRVQSDNLEFFYMLALAQEQIGKLQRAREILLRIQSVKVDFRDVEQRVSSISTRISLAVGSGLQAPDSDAATAMVDPSMLDSVETLLGGRYRLERELGRGGMGTVYLARDTQLDRPVALKFLGALIDRSEEFRQRFIREAKAAARVNHPNIVGIYDISASLGKAYIAMEYIEGPSLHAYLKEKGRLSPREAVNFALQACAALGAIHQAGIVHRDIKPDNMLIARGNLIKLTDFGLAKAEDARITGTNVTMGTPAYMSPEQTVQSDVDARSDIYSMALVLYEMLTGACVFAGKDVLQRRQEDLPPAPGSLVHGISPELDRIVLQCLANNPDDRLQSAEDLVKALRSLP